MLPLPCCFRQSGRERVEEMPMSSRLGDLLRGFDPDRTVERAQTIPSTWYYDAALADLERRAVFGDTWQAVGRTDQIEGPGSFLTADVAGEPLLVVRDESGALRAMANVCRHRGAVIVNEPAGRASRL